MVFSHAVYVLDCFTASVSAQRVAMDPVMEAVRSLAFSVLIFNAPFVVAFEWFGCG
jgi:hypothetical protein